jgi:peptide/nickel transport system ATP-binding protein
MMQRVMIVDALVADPTFLVADNITQSLDVTVAAQIIRLIEELREKFNTAIVFISSSLPVVCGLADDILVLHHGKIVERSSPQDLIKRPSHHYTKSLLARLPRIWGRDIVVPSENEGKVVLSVRDVARTYVVRKRGTFSGRNLVQAVRGLSFDVGEGENFGIVGESGCGKSTLTRLLAWLEVPDEGTILFQGRALSGLSSSELVKMRSSFQLLLQDPYNSLPPRMPVGRIIAESLLIHHKDTKEIIRQKVLSAMDEVGLPRDLENSLTVGLSAGQRQRVSIARALVLKPKLLILDETLSALDQVEQSQLLELLARLQEKHRFTYIFISHDMALVRKVCNRIAVMYLGKIVELADNSTLFDNPQHPYSKALLSAVPTLDDHPFQADDYLLDGEPPSPVDIPQGCTFRSRCPARQDICARREPDLEATVGRSLSACFFSSNKADAEKRSPEKSLERSDV